MSEVKLHRTPLYDEHVKLGARLVPFAGYEMPVQYPTGILAEHNWTREHAGLFDVSHMGQASIVGPEFQSVASAFERLVPADIQGLSIGQQRYSQLLSEDGGIIDDLMVTRSLSKELEGSLYVVVNASRKDRDYAHIRSHLPAGIELRTCDHLALLALQGPKAEEVLSAHNSAVRDLPFMHSAQLQLGGIDLHLSRSGYTGEDGFEISVAASEAATLWNLLLSDQNVRPVGLGARDSLRLEAGLCLYGHDIDETTSPVEAGLLWSIAKHRREQGGFIGAGRVQADIKNGTLRKRVGIKPDGKAPAREGTIISDKGGREIGRITSGGFGPTIGGPVAMGYVETAVSATGTQIDLMVRDKAMPATIVKLPFVPNNFKR